MEKTKPKERFPEDYKIDPATLAAGRYGTKETVDIWDAEKTYEYGLKSQGQASRTLSRLHPDIVPPTEAEEIESKANLTYVKPAKIREYEEKTGHDIIGLNKAFEEILAAAARPHQNKARTSGDTTQTAKALQLKQSLEVIADSTENVRDIIIEKSLEWEDIPYMDLTHLYDALPSVAGRAFSHYAEMLQSGLNFLKFVYDHSLIGKWADATGNHHSATALDIDGIKLQEEYCKDLGIGWMDAPAQVPGLEFEADVVYVMSRLAETMNNLSNYIALGRSDDVNVFINTSPKKQKGSAAMPHKDAKNGNPDSEEQFMSVRNYLVGNLTTAMMNCEMPYARNLSGSANTRINFEDGFKFLDHGIRRLAHISYWIKLREERSIERVLRSYGVVTSQQVMMYITDTRKVSNPLPRSKAHDLMGELATYAWENKIPFTDVVLQNEEIRKRLDEPTIRKITNPLNYLGESKKIIRTIADKYHKKRTL
ncbi:hypothetical protein J4456_04095 [Candidatus Pacearchaeota archaeon]|nr:hypothetical protein [Candidatus Pacearchaeota archaeon]